MDFVCKPQIKPHTLILIHNLSLVLLARLSYPKREKSLVKAVLASCIAGMFIV